MKPKRLSSKERRALKAAAEVLEKHDLHALANTVEYYADERS